MMWKLPCILAAITLVHASAIKGISPDRNYQPTKENTWTCLDGSQVIPFKAINDDYCDCPDGSDEPGTSACANGVFYCQNQGHLPVYIKSSAVNDGVCDEACCDGSDENGLLITCPNRCDQVGRAYREQQARLQQATEAGLQVKQQWIDEAEKQVRLWQDDQTKLEDEIVLKQSRLLQLKRDLEQLSEKSKGKSKRVCRSSVMDIATLRHDITLLQRELGTLRQILGDMKRDHNHNYHDMAVKSAIAGYDEFETRFAEIETEIEEDMKSMDKKDEEFEEEEEEEEEEEQAGENQSDVETKGKKKTPLDSVLGTLDSLLPDTLKPSVLKNWMPKEQPNITKSDPTAALEELRKQVQDAENEMNTLNSDLDKIKKDLAFDYGHQKEWLKLKDVCIEKDEGEYTYSLCFLGAAHQKSNKDSTRTYLGQFESYNDDYRTHLHTRGTRCWNGPERSVKATIECGVKNEIIEVSEPEKCEYHFRLLSPAVCQPKVESTPISKTPVHEEL
ncbi:Glucosidase 2 subunit beta [Choanephora cucurbitarum]|uniref:Glucosidase 2 subunit beta n=1 Tax=Choanephora cucurbitarum TaxID=101091 RepID=A0A1C7N5V1_9FUNG|nr:Glucosidase 2 subunit beta [Choanephora cucurbitarum]